MVFYTQEKMLTLAIDCRYLYQNLDNIDDILLALKGMYILHEYGYPPAVELFGSNLRNLLGDSR